MLARFPAFFVAALLLFGARPFVFGAQQAPPALSNATPRDAAQIATVLVRLQAAASAGDANALAYFGATLPTDGAPLQVSSRVTHVAVSASGALVREVYGAVIKRTPPVTLSTGIHELWLDRKADGTFALSPNRFVAPPDALSQLQISVERERAEEGPEVLDVVASRVGGRWIALRRQSWSGELNVQQSARTGPAGAAPRDFLFRQMERAPQKRALTAHFLFANDGTPSARWTGLGAAFNPSKRANPQFDDLASSWRGRIAGRDYTMAASHREFARALFGVGLWNEGADELKKAALLDPSVATLRELETAERNRARDPQNAVARQLQDEQSVGLGADHPTYLISALQIEQQNQPNVLGALRLALEYSRLAEDARASAWVRSAMELKDRGSFRPGDTQWMQLLFEHLRERTRLSKTKPSTILRSQLFTVRVWPDDPEVVSLLASLEEAQHTVYADFGIPMGNTEVLLWHNQSEFARYTTQFSSQGGSEFVAALTLTKLVSTRNGPLVLGEEVNTFSDTTNTQPLFGTVAHEYGPVAVRQLSRGRMVPVWFNEGIATSCEGGYEGYISRVRRATNTVTLLPMRELSEWNVDGERAFLAYSQSNSILDFMVATWGRDAVLEILRQIGRDVPPEDAFRNVLGVGQGELWNRWVREGIK